jgi:ABC-type dipeptide/oligopeptide/nickel transport system ATPase subunit
MLSDDAAERMRLLSSWATRVGLADDLLERLPHEVSEEQLQRACLARALIVTPRLSHLRRAVLDARRLDQAALLETVGAIQEQRELGVLLITHDRILADTWCGRHRRHPRAHGA